MVSWLQSRSVTMEEHGKGDCSTHGSQEAEQNGVREEGTVLKSHQLQTSQINISLIPRAAPKPIKLTARLTQHSPVLHLNLLACQLWYVHLWECQWLLNIAHSSCPIYSNLICLGLNLSSFEVSWFSLTWLFCSKSTYAFCSWIIALLGFKKILSS